MRKIDHYDISFWVPVAIVTLFLGVFLYLVQKNYGAFVSECRLQGGEPMSVGQGGRLCVRDGLIIQWNKTGQ